MRNCRKQEKEIVVSVVLVIVGRDEVTAGPHGTAAVGLKLMTLCAFSLGRYLHPEARCVERKLERETEQRQTDRDKERQRKKTETEREDRDRERREDGRGRQDKTKEKTKRRQDRTKEKKTKRRQDKTRRKRRRQKKTRQDETKENKTRQDEREEDQKKTRQDEREEDQKKTRQDEREEDKRTQDKTKEKKTKEDKTGRKRRRQKKTRQDETKENKTRQDEREDQKKTRRPGPWLFCFTGSRVPSLAVSISSRPFGTCFIQPTIHPLGLKATVVHGRFIRRRSGHVAKNNLLKTLDFGRASSSRSSCARASPHSSTRGRPHDLFAYSKFIGTHVLPVSGFLTTVSISPGDFKVNFSFKIAAITAAVTCFRNTHRPFIK